MRLATTISLDFSNVKGRGDLSPNEAWTSQTHGNPRILQDWPGMNAASSPFHQNGDFRLAATGRVGFPSRSMGLEQKWDSEANSEAAGRRERTALNSLIWSRLSEQLPCREAPSVEAGLLFEVTTCM